MPDRTPMVPPLQVQTSEQFSIGQLRSYFDEKLLQIELRNQVRYDADKTALALALENNNKRLEGMNEFRQSLNDQAARMISRIEVDAQIHALSDKVEGDRRPLETKIDGMTKTNWPLLAAIVSIVFVLVSGGWLIIGLKIEAAEAPISQAVSTISSSSVINSKAIHGLEERTADSSMANSVSKADRQQLNERMRALEGSVNTQVAARNSQVSSLVARIGEAETQARGLSDIVNIYKDTTHQWVGILFDRVFAEPLPQSLFRPTPPTRPSEVPKQ